MRTKSIVSLFMMLVTVTSALALNAYASTSVAQSSSEYVNITSIDAPAYALPEQRVTVTVQISYSFSRANASQSEIGISITRKGGTQESDVFARSRGGVVLYGGLYTYGGIYASANIVTGTREYFIALIIPNQDGPLNLTAHAFYSHGSEWVGSSSMDFVINVSESNGFQLPPTEFTGSITYESTSLSSNFSGTTSESNASVSIAPSGDSLAITLTIPGTTKYDQSNGIFYWIEIDTTDSGGSIQNPLPNYVIELLTNSSSAMLTKGDGTEIKSLLLVVGTSTYTVNGLRLSDLGNANAFSLHVRAMRWVQNFSSNCLSASSDEWASNVELLDGTNPFESCYTSSNGYDLLKVSEAPQGGWAPVTIPYPLTISTPVSVILDGTTETPTNGLVTVSVPGGEHTITAPSVADSSNGTKLQFDHWSDGTNSSVKTLDVEGNASLTAVYVTQNQPTITSTLDYTAPILLGTVVALAAACTLILLHRRKKK